MRGLAPKVRDGQLITIPHSGKSCGNLARLIYLVNRDCRYDHVNATTEATRFNHSTLQVRYNSGFLKNTSQQISSLAVVDAR
jgi:hypothetical protein